MQIKKLSQSTIETWTTEPVFESTIANVRRFLETLDLEDLQGSLAGEPVYLVQHNGRWTYLTDAQLHRQHRETGRTFIILPVSIADIFHGINELREFSGND